MNQALHALAARLTVAFDLLVQFYPEHGLFLLTDGKRQIVTNDAGEVTAMAFELARLRAIRQRR